MLSEKYPKPYGDAFLDPNYLCHETHNKLILYQCEGPVSVNTGPSNKTLRLHGPVKIFVLKPALLLSCYQGRNMNVC